MSMRSLTNFCRGTIESILPGCIKAWYGNCSAQDRKNLLTVVCTAQTITEANLPSMDSIYTLADAKKLPTSSKIYRTLVMISYNLFRQAE
eukprot:g43630.t1